MNSNILNNNCVIYYKEYQVIFQSLKFSTTSCFTCQIKTVFCTIIFIINEFCCLGYIGVVTCCLQVVGVYSGVFLFLCDKSTEKKIRKLKCSAFNVWQSIIMFFFINIDLAQIYWLVYWLQIASNIMVHW